MIRSGVLGLQGDFREHLETLRRMGVDAVDVRRPGQLDEIDALIVPGGESTTMLKLIRDYALWQPLLDFARARPLWGVCAGSILLAERVENPAQESLAVMPITVRRNAYGRQNESFIARFALRLPGRGPQEQEGVFIRAPLVTAWAAEVAVLAEHGNCSSSTVLLIVQELCRAAPPPARIVAPAFGPALTLYAARKLKRPVKWTAERSEDFLSDSQGRDQVTRAALALDAEGTILAIRVDTVANLGAYLSNFGPMIPTIPERGSENVRSSISSRSP